LVNPRNPDCHRFAFLTFCAGNQAADPAQAWIILVVGAVISFLGVPAGLIGNELSVRYGLRTIAPLVFLLPGRQERSEYSDR
jgi:hypothetical protein